MRARAVLLCVTASALAAGSLQATASSGTLAAPVLPVVRDAAPVVLTGNEVPAWSAPAATGVAQPYPSGATATYSSQLPGGLAVRSAHNGRILPVLRTGAPVDQIAAFSWTGRRWKEVPVQVDERFPYFLANARSDFGVYSGTDQELTYAWGPTAHTIGEEAWKKMFGECSARYPSSAAEVAAAVQAGYVTPGPQESLEDYTHAMADPVAGLDDDDEIALQARDSGMQAPAGTTPPKGASDGQAVAIADPLEPSHVRWTYLFLTEHGSSFTAKDSPVQMTRDADADQWIDRGSFADDSPFKLGSSNTGYGPNLPGTVCDADGTTRTSKDRFARDGMTVTTPTYKLTASGRWMVRGFQVAAPKGPGYGPDLIDRWKGRAFQQSPDSSVSLVGFEDEQVNWEANGALLGWRQGPVRAIREVWGADSGTNVTKTESYYRDADAYRYRVRVHPIPPDGLYTSWDYNKSAIGTYYNLERPGGVPIDGQNDDIGQVSDLPNGDPAYFDFPDPTFDLPSAVDRPEEVAGKGSNGGLVYAFEFKGATSAANAAVVPYYRDDACLDDGTGDDPVQRPWPGEASTDPRVQAGYAAVNGQAYAALVCDPAHGKTPFQGAYGSHGLHFLVTHDSDNATLGTPVDEIDGQQWRYSVPMATPTNVISSYAPNVLAPLQPVVTPFG
ncbi:MAG: S-layer y protein [Frankiales bacterium]|nr:S-layer y protein [Frankiales bacterium]